MKTSTLWVLTALWGLVVLGLLAASIYVVGHFVSKFW